MPLSASLLVGDLWMAPTMRLLRSPRVRYQTKMAIVSSTLTVTVVGVSASPRRIVASPRPIKTKDKNTGRNNCGLHVDVGSDQLRELLDACNQFLQNAIRS